jgi:sugar phosphate permease
VAADEHHEVYAPDQLKPGNRKRAQRGAIISAAILILFFWGNQQGNTEKVWLVVIALMLVGAVVGDIVLRRSGLRPNDQ